MSETLVFDLLTIAAAASATVFVGALWVRYANRAVTLANGRWAPFRSAPSPRLVPRLDPDVPPSARPHWDGDHTSQ